jgi:hypothetical protein
MLVSGTGSLEFNGSVKSAFGARGGVRSIRTKNSEGVGSEGVGPEGVLRRGRVGQRATKKRVRVGFACE